MREDLISQRWHEPCRLWRAWTNQILLSAQATISMYARPQNFSALWYFCGMAMEGELVSCMQESGLTYVDDTQFDTSFSSVYGAPSLQGAVELPTVPPVDCPYLSPFFLTYTYMTLVFFVETSLATLAQVFRGMQFWGTMTMGKCGLST